jgi:hypothetical protein
LYSSAEFRSEHKLAACQHSFPAFHGRKILDYFYLAFTNVLEIPAGVILALLISVSTEGKYDGGISTFKVGDVNNCGGLSRCHLRCPFIQGADSLAQGV